MSGEVDEIWALYADDGAQAMDALEEALLALQSGSGSPDGHVGAIFRAVHTFKGNSRVLGLSVVEGCAHKAEDLVGLVRDSGVPLDDEIITLLLEVSDTLRAMLETTAATKADANPDSSADIVARLMDKIARCTGAAPAADPPPQSQEAAPVEVPLAEAESEAAALADADQFTADDFDEEEPEAVMSDAGVDEEDDDDDGVMIFTKSAPKPMSEDPVYRAIFRDMVTEKLALLEGFVQAGTPDSASGPLADLAHAAKQIGMTHWEAALADLPKVMDVANLPETIAQLSALAQTDAEAAASQSTNSQGQHFLEIVSEPLATLSQIGIDFSQDIPPDDDKLAATLAAIASAAQEKGYVSVAATCELLSKAKTAAVFRRAELRLYEDFAAIDELTEFSGVGGFSPRAILDSWCADHIFDTLAELESVLVQMRAGQELSVAQVALERLTRLVLHACHRYDLDTAAHLAMSLLDLFARSQAEYEEPDAILLRIAQGFIDTLELVFDALREGDPPDTQRLEELYEEAVVASFRGSGLMTASAVERTLGLPPEFHSVLSPESVRNASEALAEGQNFFIMRADVNADEKMAEALFDFIGSGQIVPITNVTVFRGDDTLFDFLIASRLDPASLTEILVNINPDGTKLSLLRHLQPVEAQEQANHAEADPSTDKGDSVLGVELSAAVLEQIGELAAGQAMVHGILTDLSEIDLTERFAAMLWAQSTNPDQAREMADALALQLGQRLQEMMQIESQLLTQLSELQQSTAALRALPVDSILRPVIALATAKARQAGRDLRITTKGAESTHDLSLLDNLKKVLRALFLMRVDTSDDPASNIHISVRRSDEKLDVTIEDDGGTTLPSEAWAELTAQVTCFGWTMRHVSPPGGGGRFHLDLPINLVVMEGMVVGSGGARFVLPVEAIRTILQPAPSAFVNFSVQGRQNWLRLNSEEIVALCPLSKMDQATAEDRNPSLVVVLGQDDHYVAVPVDEVVGQQLVLLRPLRGALSKINGALGLALLTGGEVGTVLSARALCERALPKTGAVVH